MAVDLATFSPKRILVCQLRQIGDVVLATPSIELLKRRYPDAEIHLLTEKKCAPLLEHNPHLGKVWALDKKVLSSLPQEVAWYWHVARTGYDLVVDFQQLPRCRWVVAFSGAPVRLSYTPPWYTSLLYTHSSDMLDGYSAMSKASVLRPLGIEWNGERPRVYLTGEEHAFARTLLSQAGLQPEQRLITLDPTHRQPTRRWPLAHYAGLVSLLAERDASLRFLPLWGPGEEAGADAVAAGNGCLHRGSGFAYRQLFRAPAHRRSGGHADPHRTRFDHTGVDLPLPFPAKTLAGGKAARQEFHCLARRLKGNYGAHFLESTTL